VTTNGSSGSSKESPEEASAGAVEPPSSDNHEEGEITDVRPIFGIGYHFIITEIQKLVFNRLLTRLLYY